MQACNAHDSHTWKNALTTVMKKPTWGNCVQLPKNR